MEQFKQNTAVVLSCMKDNGYNPEVLRQYKKMYQSLSSFLFSNELAYGKEAYWKWQQRKSRAHNEENDKTCRGLYHGIP